MPQIRPITDLRNTTEISELCHAKSEPVFITKNGYGDLVIMSMETYEALLKSSIKGCPAKQSPIWAGMLADVLRQHGVPFVQESALGAGLASRMGSLSETIRFFVPVPYLTPASGLVEELFAKETE